MAVVLHFPDRSAAGPRAPGESETAGRGASILILPCIRRESLDRQKPLGRAGDLPAQLQA